MKLPTKSEVIVGFIFISVGVLTLSFFPAFVTSGWYAILFGVGFFLFPGPQLREKYKQTEETKERWRQSAKVESSKSLSWWASPFPWALFVCLVVVVVFAIVT
ncbi:hypothetical protein E0Z06_01065 [Rheinheimera sp. D18]|uniref:hypothetical protein n=1 Tax=Rheinheimera sp. D18 TaxID=2545632 RepID=UPI00104E9B3F|nr:hypothetical protein [Rheinheimera sp. D18]QBL08200.1 hypothetical protein E0Z06_01065 [Rheinheimera sp. D18]